MLWKLVFWTPVGVRLESKITIQNGIVTRRYGTWEALFFDLEESVKQFRFAVPVRIEIPLLATPFGQIPALPYLFAIALDTTATVVNSTNPSTSITRGTGASNYLGTVNLMPSGSARTCSGTTWAGTTMTQIYDLNETINGAGGHFYAFQLVNPASGAQTVTATTTAAYYMEVGSWSGVDQTTPLDTNFDGASNSYVRATQALGTTFSVTGTTHVDNSVGIGTMIDDGVGSLAASTKTTALTTTKIAWYNTAAITPAGTCSLTITDVAPPTNWLGISSAIQPFIATTTTTPLSLLPLLNVG